MVGLSGDEDHGKMESKTTQEMITSGNNDVKLQAEER